MNKGTVKWFNNQKGYGFIRDEENDVFVHYTGLNMEGFKSLEEGQTVEFEIMDVEKGKQAINVTVVENVEEGAELKRRYIVGGIHLLPTI